MHFYTSFDIEGKRGREKTRETRVQKCYKNKQKSLTGNSPTVKKLTRPCRLAFYQNDFKYIAYIQLGIFKYPIAKSPCSDLYKGIYDQIRLYSCISLDPTCSATYISMIQGIYLSTRRNNFSVKSSVKNHISDRFNVFRVHVSLYRFFALVYLYLA